MDNKVKNQLIEWIKAIAIAIVITIIILQCAWPMRSIGSSMENTVKHNQFIIVSRLASFISPIKHGDVVVLKVDREKIIKRVIGLEGDHIVIKDGEVFRNGEKLHEPYIKGKTSGEVDLIVGKNFVFVLGDNRPRSKDSREYGMIDLKQLKGKALIKVFPFDIL